MCDKLIDISSLRQTGIHKKRKKRPRKKSQNTLPERKVQQILKDLGVPFTTQYEVGNKFFDIYLPTKNILIEVDGLYWHSPDIAYEDKSLMQKKNFVNDILKNGIAATHGYKLIRIREDEISVNQIKKLIYG